ncbi:MAG: TolC family protein [Bdellovibrionales bacterium]|nr:TolC family protein [Bdellovibrionales bacterium]
MVTKKVLSLFFASLSISVFAAKDETITLTQKKMADLIIQKSFKVLETDLKFEQNKLAPYQAKSLYDWKWSLESGYEIDKTESLSLIGDYRFERYKTTAAISKSLLTGTTLSFQAARTSQKKEGDSYSTSAQAASNQYTLDSWGVNIEQSLWGNSFGTADRLKIQSAENLYKAQNILRNDELQNIVLDGLRLYWNAYVAQENFKESINSRDRYLKLVNSIRRKNSLGYTSPGELNQVLAESESREQSVKSSSEEFLKQTENLVTLLNLEPGSKIDFQTPESLPPLPADVPKDPKSIRAIKSQELKVQIAKDQMAEIKSSDKPKLSLIAQLSATGLNETSTDSFSELTRGHNPKMYVGLKLSHSFGSDVQEQEYLNKKALADMQTAILERNVSEFKDKQAQAYRKAQVALQLVNSVKKQKDYREKALNELNRSYAQGRTDIRNLIEAMNNYFSMEVAYSRAVGDYFIAINEYVALKDELIKD